ncbi:hypothetical protein M3Y96_00104300 [Aphelenchoides besseyi]|nr:hypothetical protein M3Y96_00104300 [Aphelenchoides besseyi]
MNLLVPFFLFAILSVIVCDACKIKLRVQSDTKIPFKIQIVVPSLNIKTEKTTFNAQGQEKNVVINGGNCSGKHWLFRTFRIGRDGNWELASEEKGKFDGEGYMYSKIGDDLLPRISGRGGVLCSETLICG